MTLTPERLAALRGFAENTARLPSGAPVHVEPSELLALLDAANELVRVREALKRYGRHERFHGSRADQSCKINPGGPIMAAFGRPDPHPCTCGLDAALVGGKG